MERRFDLLTRQIKTNFWATVWPYVRTDRVFGNRGRDMKIHFCPQNFAIWGYRSEIRYLAFVQGPLYLLLLYHTRAHLSSVFSNKNKKIRGLILGLSRTVEAVVFATVTACHIVGRELFIVWASATATTMLVTNVIVIGVPKSCEVIALIHGVFKSALTRDRTVAVVRTVPTIYGTMDVSHYCSPPIIIPINSAKA